MKKHVVAENIHWVLLSRVLYWYVFFFILSVSARSQEEYDPIKDKPQIDFRKSVKLKSDTLMISSDLKISSANGWAKSIRIYDSNGYLIYDKDGNYELINEYEYDKDSRMVKKRLSTYELIYVDTIIYDDQGLLSTKKRVFPRRVNEHKEDIGGDTMIFVYDQNGNCTESREFGNHYQELIFVYDQNGNCTESRMFGDSDNEWYVNKYEYDDNNRKTSVISEGERPPPDARHGPKGQLNYYKWGYFYHYWDEPDMKSEAGFDLDGARIDSTVEIYHNNKIISKRIWFKQDPDSSPYKNSEYLYDSNNNVVQIKTFNAEGVIDSKSVIIIQNYIYDAKGRVAEEDYTSLRNNSVSRKLYIYNEIGLLTDEIRYDSSNKIFHEYHRYSFYK